MTTYPNLNVSRKNRTDDEDALNRKLIAAIAVLVFHSAFFLLMYLNGFEVQLPLPTEKGIEIVFEEDRPAGMPVNQRQRVVENPPIVNVPGNSAPITAAISNENQSTRPAPQPDARPADLSDHGDVDKPVVEQVKQVNQKALFQSKSEGTEDANNPTNIRDRSLYQGVGQADQASRTADTPIGPEHRQAVTANLSGRSVVGSLPRPIYASQNQGRVVVEITVDQNGKVTKATAVGKGSTVQDVKLWRAAEQAAFQAKFNVSRDAGLFQNGTISYVFTLN